MNVRDAWLLLGENIDNVLCTIMSSSNLHERIKIADQQLEMARKISKQLMAVHHPDKNPGDLLSAGRFNRVVEAIQVIEEETKFFKEKAMAMLSKPPSLNKVIIER